MDHLELIAETEGNAHWYKSLWCGFTQTPSTVFKLYLALLDGQVP